MASGENQAGGLPATSYVLLSEFFTWALDGVARDDAAVKQLVVQQSDRDAEVWGDHFGPGWLTHLLALIRDSHEAYPKCDAADDQTYEINQRAFVRAQRWLERHGGNAADALAEVEQELARRQDRDPRHIALELLLYDRASTGKLIVKARKWDGAKNCAASEYELIPADFFLRPCRFFYSVFHDRSELVRWADDGSPNWLLDSVFNRNDPPVSYVEPKIAREDALVLRDQFITDGSPQPLALHSEANSPRILSHDKLEPLVFDPSEQVAWTFVMAIAWIAHQDIDNVRHWGKPIDIPSLGHSIEPAYHLLAIDDKLAAEARKKLWRGLQEGRLTASGIDPSTGKRGPIDKLEFLDLQLINEQGEDQLGPGRYLKPAVRREEVQRIWPKPSTRNASLAGAESKCRDWLEGEMRSSPDKPLVDRNSYLQKALLEFLGLSKEGFGRAWKQAIKATSAHAWSMPGPRSKSTGLKSSGQ